MHQAIHLLFFLTEDVPPEFLCHLAPVWICLLSRPTFFHRHPGNVLASLLGAEPAVSQIPFFVNSFFVIDHILY